MTNTATLAINPATWRTNADTSLVCPHRDLSVCDPCIAAHDDVVEVCGAAYWMPDPAERAELEALRAELAQS